MKKREIIETKQRDFLDYNRYGKLIDGLKWLPLSRDERIEYEVFLIRFEAGSSSNLHRHNGREEFYVIEGELNDSDGQLFRAGDYVKFKKGSIHSSYSKKGCTLLVIICGGKNELIE